ncbi:hypothetical protein Lfu02_21230 [Longispora fulva]|uniref:Protein associated with RNAse G/E n=1 Tax=Longispora fulva TaxID=619741 RepID=A0A8J7KLW9_9ACTN|nr:DUF402 domain-containing protein [Longispora fulva]MBG6139864.1 protein associated with RNAse G/E [Longispora fulva]GIG57751.1 hypothetical protein Lfu02_21230 [Longispora fulva]
METFVRYTKFDGSLHWNHPATYLGADQHGTWLGVPAGATLLRDTTPKTLSYKFVMLFPRDAWWTACFNAQPTRTELYCDITTVPVITPEEVTMVDLDLDVTRWRDGTVNLLDEDEFIEHQVKYDYPPQVVKSAQDSADWLLRAVRERQSPFDGIHEEWLRLVP